MQFNVIPITQKDKWNLMDLTSLHKYFLICLWQGFFQQFLEKALGQNWEKMIDLTSKLGEINNIEHNKGSKIHPQNQIILGCIMSSIPL